MASTPGSGLTKKHWFGYMFGDWAVFKFVWNITPDIREKVTAMKNAKTHTQA